MLCVMSPDEMALTKAAKHRIWDQFLNGGGTTHSPQAATLPYVIRRCEREKVPYEMYARPGEGYFIKPLKGAR
jgi:hypothetical protein